MTGRLLTTGAAAAALLALASCSNPTDSTEYRSLQSSVERSETGAEATRTELAATTAELESVQGQLSTTRDSLANMRTDYDKTVDALEARSRELDTRESRLDKRAKQLDSLASELKDREAAVNRRRTEVTDREDAVEQAEERIAASQFAGGTYVVGADLKPGEYASPGGDDCYWEFKTSTGSNASIIDNHFGPGRQLVTLSERDIFESDGCGTWSKL